METPYAALNGAYWLDDDLAPCPDCARLLDAPPAPDAGRARGAGHRPGIVAEAIGADGGTTSFRARSTGRTARGSRRWWRPPSTPRAGSTSR
ncbi:hypothetical protein [Streptomyces sp. JW3]|uniref:hypothetical protein n=1 Tax=Streptomyces sp. JW3 TaxID=3456955 RepID=UPI003FA45173